MLRLTVLLLLLANAAYFGWSQGLLAAWGLAPAQQSEPQRLRQQIKPQVLRILGNEEAGRVETAAVSGARAQECLQAGVFPEVQVANLKQVLELWPAGSWLLEPGVEPAQWIVYLGKFPSTENANRKKAELRQIGVSFEALSDPALEPGLSLGGFASEAAAAQQVEALSQRGVRGAKVVRERAELRGQLLKLPAVDDSLRPRLGDLRTALGGKTLRPCR
jgi:sporulation related protein